MAIIEISDYERWKQQQAQRTAAGANVVLSTIDAKPDEVAGDMNLGQDFAKTTGQPVPPLPMVTEYRPAFQQAIERSRNATILSSSPMLASWLNKPENAAIARDDLEGLSWWETGLRAAGNSVRRGVARIPQAYNQFQANAAAESFADQSRSFSEILADTNPMRNEDGTPMDRGIVPPGPSDLASAGWRYASSRITELLGFDEQQAAAEYQQRAGEIANSISAIPMSPAGSRYRDKFSALEPTGSIMQDLGQFATSVANDPGGFSAFLTEVAAESLPTLAATGVVAVGTRNAKAASTFMGAASGLQEAGVSPMEFFQEQGVDVSTPEGALAAIMDPNLMREAERRGITRGVVIGVMDGLSGGVAGMTLSKSAVGNAVLQSVAQAALGGLGEATAQLAAGQEFNISEVLVEALAEFVTAPIEVGSVTAGQFVRGQRAARDAEDRQAVFQELSGQAVNSKLRARMPDAFRQFVERATENGPVESVFVPADKFQEYFQGIGTDPYALADELEGVSADALRDALATGGDLKIPTATYATSIAGSEHDAFLMENMRFDPDEFTSLEAREFNERASDALNEAYAEAERMRAEDERFKSFEQEIYDTMVERLRIAGRSTDVATSEAMLFPTFYRTMAERSGMTIDELMRRYPLPQVQGELPQGIRSRSVDELNRTLAEARSQRQVNTGPRTPLLEFISEYGGMIDTGGELASRDAALIRRGRGRKNLRLARDPDAQVSSASAEKGRAFGMDDVALAAIEAGFMAGNPIVMEYQESVRSGREAPDITRALMEEIDRELSGQASMTADDLRDGVDDDTLGGLEEYLSRIGMSLDDSDADIRAAIEADQAEQGLMYGQDGRLNTDSEAFREWFGDSKVVGPDGKPLVVYHGTNADFEAFSLDAIVSTGASQGYGFYFTDNESIARGYMDDNGRMVEAYLAINKPLPSDAPAFSKNELTRIIKEAVAAEVRQDPDDVADYKDSFLSNFADTYSLSFDAAAREAVSVLLNNETAVDQIAEIANVIGSKSIAVSAVRTATGYDGIYVKDFQEGEGDVYLSWFPTQIKSVNNRGTFDANDPRILYQFAGPQSQTADIHALANARDMIDGGANAEQVRRETGWFRGPDGKWRYEISDADARFSATGIVTPDQVMMELVDEFQVAPDDRNPELFKATWGEGANYVGAFGRSIPDAQMSLARQIAKKRTPADAFDPNNIKTGTEFPLADILDHESLFAAYPDLKMIPVEFDTGLQARGQVNGYGTEMTINPNEFTSPDEMLSTILHEVQHLIQRREGFARGGNTEMTGQVRDALKKLVSLKQMEVNRYEGENWAAFENAKEARAMVGYASMYQDFDRLIGYANSDAPSGVFRHIRNATGWFYTPIIQENDDLRARASELNRSLYALPRRGPKRNQFLRQFSFDLAQLLRDAVPTDRWSLLSNDTRKTASMIKAFEREASKAGKRLKPHYDLKKDARIAKDQFEANQYRSPFEIYQLLAGEVEARNTQNRAAMTDVERRDTPPEATMTRDVSGGGNIGSDWVIRNDDGKAGVSTEEVIVVMQGGEIETPFIANMDRDSGAGVRPQEVVGTVEVDGIDLPLNKDGTVTLYHGTTADGATQIMQGGILRSAAEPSVYLTTQTTADTGYGDGTVIAVDVMPSMLRLDDEFPNGRADFAIDKSAVRVLRARLVDQRGRTYGQPAYHGSPHLFEKFSLSAIGTGEGAQAFGWGLYFAGRKDVAEYYRNELSDRKLTLRGRTDFTPAEQQAMDGMSFDFYKTMDDISDIDADTLEAWADAWENEVGGQDGAEAAAFIRSIDPSDLGVAGGRLFEVNIPEDAELLDWDAPLSEQPAAVLEKLQPMLPKFTAEDDALLAELGVEVTGEPTGNDPFLEMTGAQFYEELADRLRSDRAASEALRDAGIPGHRFFDGRSRSPGEGTRNYVIYDDNRIDVARFEQERRGSIQFPGAGVGNGDTVVNLFRKADLSTFLHESGHYFLTVLQDMARQGETASIAELDVIKSEWRKNAEAVAADAMRVMPDVTITEADVIAALDDGTTGDVLKDAAIDVGMQEQFARGFERYLMEGKAPTQELRSAFEKFRAWLMSVYKSLRGLNVEISDEMRAVFDRMLATDAEIATASEASGNAGPLFASAEDMGLSADDYAAFLRLTQQANDEASAKLLAETMAPIRRETEKWFKDERAKVRADVEREVNAYRQYRALEWMGNRRWLGEGKPEALGDFRLSKDMLVERYGAGVLKTLPRGKQTVYTVEGGIDPDVAADLFGYSSADEMIKSMEQAPPRREAIDAETDRRMFELHGDPLKDGSVQEQALNAVHGDKRARALAVELKALAEIAGSDRGMTHKEAREIARQTLARTKVRDATASNRYLSAERKAGEEARRLTATVTRTRMWADAARRKVGVQARAGVREGDTAAPARVSGQVGQANTSTQRYNENVSKLVEAKRRQLLNHALYSEARRIEAEVQSAERLVTRLSKKSTREKLAGDYLEAIDELLTRYDFRRMSGRAEDRRGALAAFIERMTAEGRENELAIPERVLQDTARTPYKKLTVEHLRGVVDSLKNIEHTARLKKTLQDAQSQRELDTVVGEIKTAFDKNLPKRPPARVGDNAEGRRDTVRRFLDLVLNATTLLREIDGREDFGPAYRNIKAPIDAAMNRLQGRRQKAAEDLDNLYEVYTKQERRSMAVREFIPEVDASLSKWERIAVALNMGNEGNYQRLTDTSVRGGFTEAQVEAIVATLDERDAAFVQSVWDYLDTFRPDIEAREKRTTGVSPKWVEARPVTIAGQTMRGGYYALRYDPRLSALARDDQAQDISKALQAGRFGKAQTRNGHLKERAQSSGRAVDLDIAVLHQHVQQVVYDIELSEPVNNSWRILQDARIREAFTDAGKQADFDALEVWLKDVAEGEIRSSDAVGKMARRFKSNFTAAKLAFNMSTVAVQITGISQSMVVVGKKDFLSGVVASMRPGVEADVIAKSQFMRDRQTTFNKDIFDLYNDPKMGPAVGRWTEVRNEWIAPAGFWLMTKVQFYSVDLPSWMAGYQQGLRKFDNNEDMAIAFADDVVKRAQASGLFSDRSAIERGSTSMAARQNDFIRLFTTLGSYMFAKFNVAYERTQRARGAIRDEGVSLRSAQEAFSWTLDMAFLFTLEAVLYMAIKGRLPDEDDEDDDWATFLARETALSIASSIPFVRDLGGIYAGFSGGGAYGAMTEELTRPLQQASQGEVDRPFVKSIINATGLFTGLPTGQINRAVDAGWRQAEGDDVSPAEYILGRMGN